jgi:hypothetical protein
VAGGPGNLYSRVHCFVSRVGAGAGASGTVYRLLKGLSPAQKQPPAMTVAETSLL